MVGLAYPRSDGYLWDAMGLTRHSPFIFLCYPGLLPFTISSKSAAERVQKRKRWRTLYVYIYIIHLYMYYIYICIYVIAYIHIVSQNVYIYIYTYNVCKNGLWISFTGCIVNTSNKHSQYGSIWNSSLSRPLQFWTFWHLVSSVLANCVEDVCFVDHVFKIIEMTS